MKTTALLAACLIGMVLPTPVIADEPAASFDARWPETPLRKPNMTELIRFIANAAKEDIELVIESGLTNDPQRAFQCSPKLCMSLNGR